MLRKELDYIELIKLSILENKFIFDEIQYTFCKIKDIKNTLKRIQNKGILDEIELFEIKNFAIQNNEIFKNYKRLNLNIDYIKFRDLDKIITLLDPDNLKLPTFQIYDSYSNELKNIRTIKSTIENEIFKESNEKKIQQLKNERLEIVVKEEKESLQIRKNISDELFNYIDDINKDIKVIGKLDFLIAKVNLAQKYGGIKPHINTKNQIYFKDAINPSMVELLSKENKTYMPISMDINKKITLISGANMGGKSVSMKNIELNLYLFQCGFYVFAK